VPAVADKAVLAIPQTAPTMLTALTRPPVPITQSVFLPLTCSVKNGRHCRPLQGVPLLTAQLAGYDLQLNNRLEH
jgi:hypothetical protein